MVEVARRIVSDTAHYKAQLDALTTKYSLISGSDPLSRIEEIVTKAQVETASQLREAESVALQLRTIKTSIAATKGRSAAFTRQSSVRDTELVKIERRLQQVDAAYSRLDTFIDSTHEVHRSISRAIEEKIREFMLGTTKDIFQDIFRRLSKAPFFNVTISDAAVRWHRPEVDWRATYADRTYPGAAVFSQGELNSCAIAFFLALAISNASGLGFLILDDPIQNMDEIHIEEFGNVLKFLKDDLKWQIVVGLHDESVHRYFKRQLFPSEEGQSLISCILEPTYEGTVIQEEVVNTFDRSAFITSVA